MGFIKVFAGSTGTTLADQWLDFLQPPAALASTAAIFPAVPNTGGVKRTYTTHVITNGSKIVVPQGYGLMTFQDGRITSFVSDPGGFIWASGDPNSRSIFAGDDLSATTQASWARFKFGGHPGSQQLAFYVNLKEIPNNRFGTPSEIYWDDAYLGTQVGATARGTYTLQIVDPILFVNNFVPASYFSRSPRIFDFTDLKNDVASQLFNEVVGSLTAAFSNYANDPDKGNRIGRIQGDMVGFAQSLRSAVEQAYRWTSDRGLTIANVALQAIEYDEDTRRLLSDVRKADALSGSRGNSFMQQAAARGIQAAGERQGDGGAGIAILGLGMNALDSATAGLRWGHPEAEYPQHGLQAYSRPQRSLPIDGASTSATAEAEDAVARLVKFKDMLDRDLITQADFEAAKAKLLGL